MTTSPASDLACFPESLRFLARRPWLAPALGALGAALGALPPALTIWAGLPDQEIVRQALAFVALLPLEMYFVPRCQAEADAWLGGHPAHPPAEWRQRFEQRWPLAMAARFLLYGCAILATVILMAPLMALLPLLGQSVLVLPTLLVAFLFGWAPLRVLLRGEAPIPAFRGSLDLVKRTWRRMLTVLLGIGVVYIACLTVASLVMGGPSTDPTPWERIVRPGIWIGNFLAALVNVWASVVLLMLFRKIDPPAAPEDSTSTNKTTFYS